MTDGSLLEKGAHIVVVGGTGRPDDASLAKVDVYLRFGDTPAPVGHPELATDAEHIGYEARPLAGKHGDGRRSRRKHGIALPDRRITLADLVQGRAKGPHVGGPDHLFGARQSAGRAVLRGRRQGLRGGEAGRDSGA